MGLSAAVQEAPKLLKTASRAPRYIKSAVKDAPRALNKLGPEDFLGSGVKRKSLTGLYSVAGAVGLGATSIAYNGINMKARQSEAIRKQRSTYFVVRAAGMVLTNRFVGRNRRGRESASLVSYFATAKNTTAEKTNLVGCNNQYV